MSRSHLRRKGPPATGEPVGVSGSVVPFPDRIDDETSYLLLAVRQADQALKSRGAIQYDGGGHPRRLEYGVDRKYLPAIDLQTSRGDDVFASERLIRALAGAVASGWEAEMVPHLTPVRVSGHRWYRLRSVGFAGPLVETAMADDTPLHPLSFDGAGGSGHDVRWSPWLGSGRWAWRGLVVPGRLLRAIIGEIPELACGVVAVEVRGPRPAREEQPGAIVRDEPLPPEPLALPEIMARIEARADLHDLAPPATADELAHVQKQAPFALGDDYLALLRRWNGLRLLARRDGSDTAALTVWPVGSGGQRDELGSTLSEWGSFVDVGSFPFAQDPEAGVVWALAADGTVHGLGREGILYGPDVPFATWLGDQLRDAEYLFDERERLEDAELWLWEGRM